MAIEGSIVVQFGDAVDDESFVVVELDDKVNKDNIGNVITTFLPSESAGFIVHFDESLLRVDSVECSSGKVTGGDRTERDRTQQVQFVNTEDKVELSYIPAGEVEFEWYAEGADGNEPEIDVDGKKMLALSETPGIGEATFNINCRAYTLEPPALELDEDESYPILCVINMEVAI